MHGICAISNIIKPFDRELIIEASIFGTRFTGTLVTLAKGMSLLQLLKNDYYLVMRHLSVAMWLLAALL